MQKYPKSCMIFFSNDALFWRLYNIYIVSASNKPLHRRNKQKQKQKQTKQNDPEDLPTYM